MSEKKIEECTRCGELAEVKVDWPELHLCDDCTNDEINEKGKL